MEFVKMLNENKYYNKIEASNSDLTVILILKDRVQFTFRWMRYVDAVHFPFKILIADGGSDEKIMQQLAIQENYPNVNYEYIRYPYDETYKHFYIKIVDVISRVDTPYVLMADNDDFFLVDGIKLSIDFLKKNKDFSSCRGI